MAAAAVTTVVGAVAGGWLSDRTGRRKVFLVVAASILAVALVVPLISPSTGAVVVFAVLQGFGGGLFLSCGTALAMDVLPDPAGGAGKDLGLLGVAVNLPQAIAPALAAVTISAFGGYRALIATALVCAVLCAVVVTRVRTVR
jgi:MFS family permease